MVDLVILRTEEVGLVAVDVIVFDVITKVVVATSGADDVTGEDWLCVATEEVVVVTPEATDVTDEDWLPVVALGANIASVLTAKSFHRTLSKVTRTYTFPHKMINNTSE